MKLVKKPISLRERLRFFRGSFDWLRHNYLPSYNDETKQWTYEYHEWGSRLFCFYGGVDTAIRGYVYGLGDSA